MLHNSHNISQTLADIMIHGNIITDDLNLKYESCTKINALHKFLNYQTSKYQMIIVVLPQKQSPWIKFSNKSVQIVDM